MIRKYIISDNELYWFVKKLLTDLERNLIKFSEFNLNIDKLNELKTELDNFEAFQSDSTSRTRLSTLIYEKNEFKSSIIEICKVMDLRVISKFGKNSSERRILNLSNVQKFNDGELVTVLKSGVEYLTELLPQMADVGLTEESIEELENLTNGFYDSVNEAKKMANARIDLTKERIEMGNRLYDKAMLYCSYGKRVFKNKDDFMYKRFLLPKRAPLVLKTPMILNYDAEKGLFWWDEVASATSYQLQEGDGTIFWEIYTGAEASFQYTPPAGKKFYRIRPRNLRGFGVFSEEMEIGG